MRIFIDHGLYELYGILFFNSLYSWSFLPTQKGRGTLEQTFYKCLIVEYLQILHTFAQTDVSNWGFKLV